MTDEERVIDLAKRLFPALRNRLDDVDVLTSDLRYRLGQVDRLITGGDPTERAAAKITAARELVRAYTGQLLAMWLSPTLWRHGENAVEEE